MGHELAVNNAVPPPPPTSLAPGFRFHPTDEELVQYYLKRKVCEKPFRFEAVSEIDVYKSEPWGLARHSRLQSRDLEWYFFSPVDRKYCNGSRLNRATGSGYWKATGKDRLVSHKGKTIGLKKTLVFHGGRAPGGQRTNWVMHEYRLVDEELQRAGVAQNAFVLCRIFLKSGLGPPTANRYAPFIEEEWDDGTLMVVPGQEAGDEMANGDDVQFEGNEFEDNMTYTMFKAPPLNSDIPSSSGTIVPYICKRERSEEYPYPTEVGEPSNKRAKRDDPSTGQGNGSEESTTTTHDLCTSATEATTDQPAVDVPSTSLELPLLEPPQAKAKNHPNNTPTFNAAELEKSVPPGYLKFISNLENEILNVSMEKETLKIELMRAQAMINMLQSRIEVLESENGDLLKVVRDV